MRERDANNPETTFLGGNDFVERLARYYMLDSVACEMHNEGRSLEGNKESSDIAWMARTIYHLDYGVRDLERAAPNVQERYRKLAAATMAAIPALMARMAARCIRISKATRTIIEAEKLREEYEKIKSMPGRPG